MLFDARLNHIRTAAKLRPNAQVQGRPLGVAEACTGGCVPCNAQLGRCQLELAYTF